MEVNKHNAEYLLEKIKNSKGLKENRQLIIDFYHERLAAGAKYGTLANHLKILSRLVVYAKKPFKKMKKAELVTFFNDLKPCKSGLKTRYGYFVREVEEYSPHTTIRMKANVKVFWKWICLGDKKIERDEKGIPLAVAWLKTSYRNVKSKRTKDVLNRDEIDQMIKATDSTRTKALIAILFESGMRAGELLGMRRSKVQFFEDYCEFICDGKTGERPVVLVKSYPYFKKWLEELNTRRDIPKTYADQVWITTDFFPGDKPKPMSINTLRNVVKYAGEKAGISKRVWIHGFRHSSATDFAKQGYNEAELRLKFGWTTTSDIPSNYTHYKHDELRNKILIKSGKEGNVKEFDGDTLPLKECPFCSMENPEGGEFCYKCGKPMTIQKIKEAEKQVKALETMQSIIGELKNLERKGFDIQQFNSFMQSWSNQNKGDG